MKTKGSVRIVTGTCLSYIIGFYEKKESEINKINIRFLLDCFSSLNIQLSLLSSAILSTKFAGNMPDFDPIVPVHQLSSI